jgi:hypothetical protein
MVEFTPSTAKTPGATEHFHPFKEYWRGADADGRGAEEDSSGG